MCRDGTRWVSAIIPQRIEHVGRSPLRRNGIGKVGREPVVRGLAVQLSKTERPATGVAGRSDQVEGDRLRPVSSGSVGVGASSGQLHRRGLDTPGLHALHGPERQLLLPGDDR